MPARRLALAGLLLLVVLPLATPLLASAQVNSADQLCSPDADPCVVSTAQTVVSGAMLNFGERTLKLLPSGRLTSSGGTIAIFAGALQIDAGGKISVEGSADSRGGDLSLSIGDLASLAGTIDASGNSGGHVTITAGRFDIAPTGSLFATFRGDGDGGDVDVVADEINVNGIVRVNSSSAGGAGQIDLGAATLLTVSGIIEAKGGENDGGIVDIASGGNVTIFASGAIRLDAAGFGNGGDLSVAAGDTFQGSGDGALVLQGSVSASGGSTPDGGGDAGSIDLSSGNECTISGKLTTVSGPPDGGGGEIAVSCSEQRPGDMNLSAEIDVHGAGTEGGAGSVVLTTTQGSIFISNKINASANAGGGGSVSVDSNESIVLSDRISANSAGGSGGDVSLSALGADDANVLLAANGSINADGSGDAGEGGSILLESCTSRVELRTGGGQSLTANGAQGTGAIALTGVNRVQVAGKLTTAGTITLTYRDFPPAIEATASFNPTEIQVLDETLLGCGTPQPTRTRSKTPTIPTPTATPSRAIPTSTPTRTRTVTPSGPTVTPTAKPTPAGPNDTDCSGVLVPDETGGVITAIYDASAFAMCANADANDDGSVTAADLPAVIRNVARSQ